jgi:hypothetical protein
MPLTIPPSVNYPSPQVFQPDILGRSPPEGQGHIQYEIDWGSMGGADNNVTCQPNNNPATPNQISQICALAVDNSYSGADVQFIFPDTGFTFTVPAYESGIIEPVFTRSLFFYVYSPMAEAEDITRFLVLNYVPPPAVLPQTKTAETEVFNDIPNDGSTTTQIIANTIDGSILGLDIFVTCADASAGFSNEYILEDGNSNTIAGFQVAAPINGNINATMVRYSDCRIRFQGGLKLVGAGGGTAYGHISVNVLYRTP